MFRALLLGAIALAACLPAQQREPAVEVYGLVGTYLHGNLSVATEWKPQFGGGVLLPLGRRWGLLGDVTTSTVDRFFAHPHSPPGTLPEENYARERRVVMTPSAVRLWRRDAFSIYAGAGFGWEHERRRSRVRPILGQTPDGQLVLEDRLVESHDTRTDAMLVLRIGTVISVGRRMVLRGDLSLLPRYTDETASKSATFGVGWRF